MEQESKLAVGIRSKLGDIARTQAGVEEVPRGSNSGEAIRHYQAATNLDGTGWPWCAAFVDWCVDRWQRETQAETGVASPFNRPRTAAAYGLLSWAKVEAERGVRIFAPAGGYVPARGDVVVYGFSHCGIVAGAVADDVFSAYEGNTNPDGGREGYIVCARMRHRREVRGFIHLPV